MREELDFPDSGAARAEEARYRAALAVCVAGFLAGCLATLALLWTLGGITAAHGERTTAGLPAPGEGQEQPR